MPILEIQVVKSDFAESRVVERPAPELQPGQIRARIERFALTANNVSYALSGDQIGYWRFFPAEAPFGIVPVWGFAEIEASTHPDLKVGERIWGFLPMASHVVMSPTEVRGGGFVDGVEHRQALPAIYNRYQRVDGDAPALAALADERCLLFPLFSTSYVLYDYLIDNGIFGAEQVVIASASSKTGLGLGMLLHRHPAPRPEVVALTSPGNVAFCARLGCYDAIVTYDAIGAMDGGAKTAFVDMAGRGAVVQAIHDRFGQNLTLSCAVGATHWDGGRFRGAPAGAQHTFFFAPAQFAKRDAEWGPGEILRRAQQASAELALALKDTLEIRHVQGPGAVQEAFAALVANQTPPDVGIMAALV